MKTYKLMSENTNEKNIILEKEEIQNGTHCNGCSVRPIIGRRLHHSKEECGNDHTNFCENCVKCGEESKLLFNAEFESTMTLSFFDAKMLLQRTSCELSNETNNEGILYSNVRDQLIGGLMVAWTLVGPKSSEILFSLTQLFQTSGLDPIHQQMAVNILENGLQEHIDKQNAN